MKHFIVGASGQVGGALVNELRSRGEEVLGTYYDHPCPGYVRLDMRDRDGVAKALRNAAPDAIWIPGAMPDVDRCEREPELSYAINVEGPTLLMEEAFARKTALVYFSSDYVFDGADGPYGESAPVNPLQVYGRHKVEAERRLLSYENTLIIRPAWIYSDERNPRNFVFRVLTALHQGSIIKAAIDQYNTPTPAGPLASHALDAWQAGYRGILHLVGPERMTRADLVARIARLAGYDHPEIDLVKLGDLPLPAARPAQGGLVTEMLSFAIQERFEDLDFRKILGGM